MSEYYLKFRKNLRSIGRNTEQLEKTIGGCSKTYINSDRF